MRRKHIEKKEKKYIYKIITIVILVDIIVISIIAGIMFLTNRNSISNEDRIIKKVSKIMILPDEKPIINTIEDATGLKKVSSFYNSVKNGDTILIYAKSATIVIYRESENKIINVGPILNDVK